MHKEMWLLQPALILLASGALCTAESTNCTTSEPTEGPEDIIYIGVGCGGGLLILVVLVLLVVICCLKAKLVNLERQIHNKQEEVNSNTKPDDPEQAFSNPTYSNDSVSQDAPTSNTAGQSEVMYAVVEGPQLELDSQPANRKSVTFSDGNYDYVTHEVRKTSVKNTTTETPNYCEIGLEKPAAPYETVAKPTNTNPKQQQQQQQQQTQKSKLEQTPVVYAMPNKKKIKQAEIKPREYDRLWQIGPTSDPSSKRLSLTKEANGSSSSKEGRYIKTDTGTGSKARPSSDEVHGETTFYSPPLPPPLKFEDMQFSPTRTVKSQEHILNPLGGHYDVPRRLQCHASCDGLYCNTMPALFEGTAATEDTARVLYDEPQLPVYGNIGQ